MDIEGKAIKRANHEVFGLASARNMIASLIVREGVTKCHSGELVKPISLEAQAVIEETTKFLQ